MKLIIITIVGINTYLHAQFENFNLIKQNLDIPQVSLNEKINRIEGNVIKSPYLIANTSKRYIIGYVKNEKEYREFVDIYSQILKGANFSITNIEKKDEMVIIEYIHNSKPELAIRRFIADEMKYNANDINEIIKLKQEIKQHAENNDLSVISDFIADTEILRKTFILYYTTQLKDNPAKEIQLRYLNRGEIIDLEIIQNSVKIIKKDTDYSIAYIGKELGFVTKPAIDEKDAEKKIEDYKKFLIENKKELIGYKIKKLDKPIESSIATFNFIVNFYFFQ